MTDKLKDYHFDIGKYSTAALCSEAGMLTVEEAGRLFRLDPVPPELGDSANYIEKAKETHDLCYVFFFLHHFEGYFNRTINRFAVRNEVYGAEHMMDMKFACRDVVLERFTDYDPTKGATFLTYIHRFIQDALLNYLRSCETWSTNSLTDYKRLRRAAVHLHKCNGNGEKAAEAYAEEQGCSMETARMRLLGAHLLHNRALPAETEDEDGDNDKQTNEELIPDHWDYVGIMWDLMDSAAMDKAFRKLSFREQTLLEKRNAICMHCGRVSSLKTRATFEELAMMFQSTGTDGTEIAYKKAVEHLLLELVKAKQLHCVRIKQQSVTTIKRKKTAAVYIYQLDNDGPWGEIYFDLINQDAEVITFAKRDEIVFNWDKEDAAIRAVLDAVNKDEKLPKSALIPVEMQDEERHCMRQDDAPL